MHPWHPPGYGLVMGLSKSVDSIAHMYIYNVNITKLYIKNSFQKL